MKILFVIRSTDQFLYFRSIVEALCSRGHIVKLLFDPKWTKSEPLDNLGNIKKRFQNFYCAPALVRKGFLRNILFHTRELKTYRSYLLEPRRSLRLAYQERWRRYLPHALQFLLNFVLAKAVFKARLFGALLNFFEKIAPADRAILKDIRAFDPAVVVASPVNMRFSSSDLEYLKAAKFLGIPTAVPVYSWDNLTTKGLYHVLPDALLAWNDAHAEEAQAYQGIRKDKIKIIGAPLFDSWFANIKTSDAPTDIRRLEFCERYGLRHEDPIILYLGSSKNIAEDESWLVEELRASFDKARDERLRRSQIIIRPHPANSDIYERLKSRDVFVLPPRGTLPDTDESLKFFYDSLQNSIAVLGINTSAMLEAIIAGRPVVTVITERHRDAQLDMAYFRQLLEREAIAVSYSPEEAVKIIGQLHGGNDIWQEKRRKFIRDFIRPRGLDFSAGEAAADEIESLLRAC